MTQVTRAPQKLTPAKRSKTAAKPKNAKPKKATLETVQIVPDQQAEQAQVSSTVASPENAESVKEFKKPDLINEVVKVSGIPKRHAKPAIEAALAVLGEALSDGKVLNLQPLGKIKTTRTKTLENGLVMNLRVRRSRNAVGARKRDEG